jgi:hypothetical protein
VGKGTGRVGNIQRQTILLKEPIPKMMNINMNNNTNPGRLSNRRIVKKQHQQQQNTLNREQKKTMCMIENKNCVCGCQKILLI